MKNTASLAALQCRAEHVLTLRPVPSRQLPLDERLEEMLRSRQPGQTFSQSEIARYCGVAQPTIQRIEESARIKLVHALFDADPQLVRELFPAAPMVEVCARLHRDGVRVRRSA